MNFTCGETSGHWHNGAVEGLSHVLIRRHAPYEDLDRRRHAYHANGASQSQVSSVQVLGTYLGNPPPPPGGPRESPLPEKRELPLLKLRLSPLPELHEPLLPESREPSLLESSEP